MTELCRGYGISRPTGYELWHRYGNEGAAGLEERSRAPARHPNQTPPEIEEQVLALRRAHMRWGPRKLKAYLERKQPRENGPAASTMGELLQREGLVIGRKARRKVPPYTQPFQAARQPNQLWCADFKGWFRTGDGERIDPLTATARRRRAPIRRGCTNRNMAAHWRYGKFGNAASLLGNTKTCSEQDAERGARRSAGDRRALLSRVLRRLSAGAV